MKAFQLSTKNLDQAAALAAEYLEEGGVVLLPTETSYGLAADAANQVAVEQVFALKGRPVTNQRCAVVVSSRQQAEGLAMFSEPADRIWDAFMPGPLTVVLPAKDEADLCQAVLGDDQTIGLRYSAHPFTQRLAERFGRPFTATSANLAGQPPAYTAQEFLESVETSPHLVIDAGPLPIDLVSTVVSVSDTVEVLREGAIPTSEIERVAAS